MLEKNEKKLYFDAHFHYFECKNDKNLPFPKNYTGISCSHSINEYNFFEKNIEECKSDYQTENIKIYSSYGLHPQSAEFIDIEKNLEFLEKLLQQNKLSAIGETGFDFFAQNFKNHKEKQEIMFNGQLDLAIKYNKPIVIHCRKANEKLFEYSKQLKKLPSVLFHSFMGMPNEAFSLLNRGINGFFSFGKQMSNGNKKVIACVKELPVDVLLLETDAPFQTLKNEEFTSPQDIEKIYDAFFELRNIEKNYQMFEKNFAKFLCEN